jgi:hypothetical protein
VSKGGHVIPPDLQRKFVEQINATTLSLNASHNSLVSYPNEIAVRFFRGIGYEIKRAPKAQTRTCKTKEIQTRDHIFKLLINQSGDNDKV